MKAEDDNQQEWSGDLMARTRATISTSIHADPQWRALEPMSKLTYYTVLAQPGLTLAGCVDYHAERLAAMIGCDLDDVHRAIDELEGAGYVITDVDTFELVVRTFVRHDVGSEANRNTVAGVWSAWGTIMSTGLRQVVLDNCPERLFEHPAAPPRTTVRTTVTTTDGTTDPTTDRTTSTASSSSTSSSPSTKTCPPESSKALALVSEPGAPATPTPAIETQWEKFWETYPRKTGKLKARAAWDSCRKRLPAEKILAAVEAHLPAWSTFEPEFIPHPATWLSQGRYLDPPPKPRTLNGGKPSKSQINQQRIAASVARMNGAGA